MLVVVALIAGLGSRPLAECPFDSDERIAVAILASFLGLPRSAVSVQDVEPLGSAVFRVQASAASVPGYEQPLDTAGDLVALVDVRGGYVSRCDWKRGFVTSYEKYLDGPPWPEPWGETIASLVAFVRSRLPSFSCAHWPLDPRGPKRVFLCFAQGDPRPRAMELFVSERQGPGVQDAATGTSLFISCTLPDLRMLYWDYRLGRFVDLGEVKVDREAASQVALRVAAEEGWDKQAEGPLQVASENSKLVLGASGSPPCWTVWIRIPRTFRGWVTRQGKRVYVEEPTFEQRGVRIDAITGEVLGIYPRDAFKDRATEAQQGPDDASE